MRETVTVAVQEPSQVGEARRIAAALASRAGLNETHGGRLALAVTEVANNLVRHTAGGEIVLSGGVRDGHPEVDVLALDGGPGMTNVAECLRDGYSTGGTAGQGLGAIQRQSDVFDLYSLPEVGTAVYSRIGGGPASSVAGLRVMEIGAVCVAKPGQEVCGDQWTAHEELGRAVLALADGLGHGFIAAEASREAVRVSREQAAGSPGQIIEAAHLALRSTRGAALAVTEVRAGEPEIRYAGVGNIAATIAGSESVSHLVSHNGTVGHQLRKVQEFTYTWPGDSLLIMHSDGLSTSWRLDRYPGLLLKHPALVAGVLYRDFKRGRDDVTVLVARRPEARGRA